ncbi:hypothetical protein Tel_06445 [Candidatus Tenderia electrophaga]|uniref:Uncharacterized protein n=1 Tax=Candidatus Tenderia electrophaga TaxID=1748243 RepID=A0A0S2TCC0_9GAMM|nr:hypothetical protein Tel_06445 [Candidatus Tenderia electrophaga]
MGSDMGGFFWFFTAGRKSGLIINELSGVLELRFSAGVRGGGLRAMSRSKEPQSMTLTLLIRALLIRW